MFALRHYKYKCQLILPDVMLYTNYLTHLSKQPNPCLTLTHSMN